MRPGAWAIRRYGRALAHSTASSFSQTPGILTKCGLALYGDFIAYHPLRHIADRRCKRCERMVGQPAPAAVVPFVRPA